MTGSGRRPRSDKGHIRVTQRDKDILLPMVEQYGFRRDQAMRYLGRHAQGATKKPGEISPSTAYGIIERWSALGWVEAVSIYKNQPGWLYVTEQGLRALSSPYKLWVPPESGIQLDHKYWVNEVWMLLEERHPHGRWVSERHLRHTRDMKHYPDAELYLPNVPKPIAIEVECSPKESPRLLEDIMPWLAERYWTTWYFAVHRAVLVRVRDKHERLAPHQRERIFISRYDERNQVWHTDLGQAPLRSGPVEPDPEPVEPEPPRTEQPAASSEVLQEIADQWVPPSGNQLGSKRLPLLYPHHLPRTFEDAVKTAREMLTDWDKAMLREMQGFAHSELLWEWSQRLQEQLGLHFWQNFNSWGVHENRALWEACGKRYPLEIIFRLTEEVWRRFQGSPPPEYSRQLVLAEPLSPLPRAEWPSTLEEAASLARSLLSPFEVLWLHGHHKHDTWYGEQFPLGGWKKNLRDQFGLHPPPSKGDWEWNKTLWLAAETKGKPIEEQRREVEWLLHRVTHEVVWGLDREARDAQQREPPHAQSTEPQSWERFSSGSTSDVSAQEPEAPPKPSKLSLAGCSIGLLGGLSVLIGVVLLAFLHTFIPGILFLLLGLAAFAVGIYLAAHY